MKDRRGLTVDLAGGLTLDDHPVLRAVFVTLQRQPSAGVHMDSLDLVALGHVDDVPRTPRALLGVLDHGRQGTARRGARGQAPGPRTWFVGWRAIRDESSRTATGPSAPSRSHCVLEPRPAASCPWEAR